MNKVYFFAAIITLLFSIAQTTKFHQYWQHKLTSTLNDDEEGGFSYLRVTLAYEFEHPKWDIWRAVYVQFTDGRLPTQSESNSLVSAHPETVFLPNLCVMLKILSSKYQLYACGKIFRMPRSLRYLTLNKNPRFCTDTSILFH